MTAPLGPNLAPTIGGFEALVTARLSHVATTYDRSRGPVSVRAFLPGVPEAAWQALDVQAMAMEDLGADASPQELARSVAGVMAVSVGALHDFGGAIIGPGRRSFIDMFTQRLARVAQIPITDRLRGVELSRCEAALEGYLRQGLRAQGRLVHPGPRGAEQVWVWTNGDGQTQPGWVQRPLTQHAASLAVTALDLFESGLARSRHEDPPFTTSPLVLRRVTYEGLLQEAAAQARGANQQ